MVHGELGQDGLTVVPLVMEGSMPGLASATNLHPCQGVCDARVKALRTPPATLTLVQLKVWHLKHYLNVKLRSQMSLLKNWPALFIITLESYRSDNIISMITLPKQTNIVSPF